MVRPVKNLGERIKALRMLNVEEPVGGFCPLRAYVRDREMSDSNANSLYPQSDQGICKESTCVLCAVDKRSSGLGTSRHSEPVEQGNEYRPRIERVLDRREPFKNQKRSTPHSEVESEFYPVEGRREQSDDMGKL
jgi:hypothetical protein